MAYDFNFGSKTAKSGFATEKEVVNKFNSWIQDDDAKEWLKIMGYPLKRIKEVKAFHVPTRLSEEKIKFFGLEKDEDIQFKKADAQIRVLVKIDELWKVENLSIKKISRGDYNQVDKRMVDSYQKIWKFSKSIATSLKLFTGEINPQQFDKYEEFMQVSCKELRNKNRIFLDELKEKKLLEILTFFCDNKYLVIADVVKGRGALSAGWIMVIKYDDDQRMTEWSLVNINIALNKYCNGNVCLTKKGSLAIGNVIMQRKGGTPDPTKLQFKIKPSLLFRCIA